MGRPFISAPGRVARGTLCLVPTETVPLPADDPDLQSLTLDELELRWADAAARGAISAETMTGLDRKAQASGVAGETLMEHAGTAVAAAAHALALRNGREDRPVLILAGPGNNGGDGFVAARRLADGASRRSWSSWRPRSGPGRLTPRATGSGSRASRTSR